MMKIGFLILLTMLLGIGAGHADDWQRADVYLVDWDVLTRVALTPERVRQTAEFKRTFRDDAPEVARLLELHKLKPAKDKDKAPEDARFVIDLTDDTMQRHTYYASLLSLCSADNKFKRAIDEKFRERISRLVKKGKIK